MIIRTKIVCTIGPASRDAAVLKKLVQTGCDVLRINFSHGTCEEHQQSLDNIRHVEAAIGQPLAVMADLCGPKIRVGKIAGGSVLLAEGASIIIQRQPVEGNAARISTTLAELVDEVKAGETILLDDGKLRLEVTEAHAPDCFVCKVVRGGMLSSGKGVNLPHTTLKFSALTEKDRQDVEWLAGKGFDYVALSFVRSAQDVVALRELLAAHGCGAHIVAKIEKPQALEHIEEIIDAADAIMVARGDLGVEMDLPAVPVAQKRIVQLCQVAGKPCIVATQMLESMINSPIPTRAEVSDVANAALDHADAVMLSGETAVGKFPVEAVSMMNDTLAAIEAWHDDLHELPHVHDSAAPTCAALAAAVREILRVEKVAAVSIFTISGATARVFSKSRLPVPILAMSPDLSAVRRMCLYYAVAAVRQADPPEHTRQVLDIAAAEAMEQKIAAAGDKIIVISGRPIGQPGHTNTLVVHTIERR
jgi:pyruvate kinase